MSTTQVADEAQAGDQPEHQAEDEGRSGEPRPEKVAVVDAVRDELSSNPATLLTEYRGLSVGELAELRAALREAGADYVVVKNTLARIAARDAGFEGLVEFLSGPTALTYCSDDPVGPAKALRQFSKDHPELVIKGGILEGRVVDAETAGKLADLESREDLLARLAQLMYGALANTASLLQAPLSKMARLLAAYQEEGDLPEGEAPATPVAEDEPEAEADEEPEAAEEPETAEADEEPEAAEEPETAEADEEPEAAGAEDEPEATEEDEADGAVETVADTAADAVETAADVADTAVEAAAETAKDVAEDTPVEGVVDAAADVTEAVTDAATDTVEGAAETAADAAAGSGEDEAGADDADDTDDEDDEEQS